MKPGFLRPGELIIPLTLLAFAGTGITFVSSVLNTTTRWAFLLALSLFLLFFRYRDVTDLLRRPLFWAVMAYASWCFMTVMWSEVPVLSLVKSAVFVWLAVTMMIAGYSWVTHHERAHACDFLWLFAVFALLAAPFGQAEVNLDTSSVVYAGSTGNPNFLGFLLATASAWLMWQALLAYRKDRNRFRLFMGLLAVDAYYLFLSHARASLLIFAFIVLGLLLGMGKIKKFLPYLMIGSALFLSAYNYYPPFNDVVTRYAFKSNLEYLESFDAGIAGGILFSREQIWQESYERAMRGGALGAGYGVTMGEKFSGEIGATVSSGEYGREQGSAQLAILEQTGFIGFGFYLALIIAICGVFILGMRGSLVNSDRIATGLIGGAIAGLLVQSVLEAWWVAPGSPESAAFWMLLGALLATTRRAQLVSPLRNQAAGFGETADASGTDATGVRS